MENYFSISQACTTKFRPPVSYRVREYFVNFLVDNLLKEKKLIIGGKWHINLTIYFVGEGKLGLPKNIVIGKSPRTVSAEMTKLYEALIPVKLIQESDRPFLKTIELMYEALTVFFTATYKKITKEFMDELWKQVDLNYLLSLPYPAPMEDQKYVGDVIQPDGSIKNVIPIPD